MEYLHPIIEAFLHGANQEKAPWMINYMKGKFDFLGLETKKRRVIQKEFFNTYGYPKPEELNEVVSHLWQLPQREFQYLAIDLLKKFEKKLQKEHIVLIEKLVLEKSWWDSVDGLAAWICGSYFQLYPSQIPVITRQWMNSGNFWLQRCCLLFQLKYKETTDTDLLESFIGKLHAEKEFFIRKAIGWVLREYSKTNPDWVRDFVKCQALSPLSYKEATKYI